MHLTIPPQWLVEQMSACRITAVVFSAICAAFMSCMLFIGRSSHYMVWMCGCALGLFIVFGVFLHWITIIFPTICFCMLLILSHQSASSPGHVFFFFFFTPYSHMEITLLYIAIKYVNGYCQFSCFHPTLNRIVPLCLLPAWKSLMLVSFSNKEMNESITIRFLTITKSLCQLVYRAFSPSPLSSSLSFGPPAHAARERREKPPSHMRFLDCKESKWKTKALCLKIRGGKRSIVRTDLMCSSFFFPSFFSLLGDVFIYKPSFSRGRERV